ncbi:MAG: sulfate/molybdate ABC transporter ATP-binding protein [Acidimicrobiia bacterium]
MSGLDAVIELHRPWLDLGLTLEVAPGSTAVLLGPNGAGKSTAVNVIAGALPLDDGHLRLGDRVLDDPGTGVFLTPDQRNVGIVFQDLLLFPNLDVVDNVAFGLRSRGISAAASREEARRWLDRLDVNHVAGRKPAELSGGEAQRVALARAMVIDPELLLLDEPMAALDATARVQVRRVVADHLQAFTGPRLLVTHDPAEAAVLGDEVFVIEQGSLTQRGEPASLRLRPRSRYVADLVGTNLVTGRGEGSRIVADGHVLQTAYRGLSGPVAAIIHPRAVALHLARPSGSARNNWRTMVRMIEDLGERVRVELGEPLPLTAEVTPDALSELALAPASEVWVSIKATEIEVTET